MAPLLGTIPLGDPSDQHTGRNDDFACEQAAVEREGTELDAHAPAGFHVAPLAALLHLDGEVDACSAGKVLEDGLGAADESEEDRCEHGLGTDELKLGFEHCGCL